MFILLRACVVHGDIAIYFSVRNMDSEGRGKIGI